MYRKTNKGEETQRLFFALWPPPDAARALHEWAQAAHAAAGGRVTRKETIHLTLAFLGDVAHARVEALIDLANRVHARPFDLVLDEARCWAHNGIVWVGPREMPEALRDLATQLDAALKAAGFRTEKRDFKAHLTLLRKAAPGAALPHLPAVSWRAGEFVLVRSALGAEGPAYSTLARFALGRRVAPAG